ncbi:MAG: sulfur carrier protein ThiS [Dehalococcoidales bacterium]|nr:sulfur carrier protein ThiS [Dehalococcoidales bacterium]
MQIIVNGKAAEMADGASVRELMQARKLQDKGFIIVLNGDVIAPEQSQGVRLKPDDTVDIIQIIEGG